MNVKDVETKPQKIHFHLWISNVLDYAQYRTYFRNLRNTQFFLITDLYDANSVDYWDPHDYEEEILWNREDPVMLRIQEELQSEVFHEEGQFDDAEEDEEFPEEMPKVWWFYFWKLRLVLFLPRDDDNRARDPRSWQVLKTFNYATLFACWWSHQQSFRDHICWFWTLNWVQKLNPISIVSPNNPFLRDARLH